MWYSKNIGQSLIFFFLILTLVSGLTFIMVRNAWLGDDAFVTFRTVDNFVNGYGLTWNVNERVQGYTHPLWMFLLSGVYFFTREIYYTSLIVSIIISTIAVLVYALKVSKTWIASAIGITALAVSKSFIDYTASGLENPLTYLLIGLFFFIFLKKEHNEWTLFLLALIAALGAVNRMDTVLLFAPAALYAYINSKKWGKGILMALAGGLPLFLWLMFSTLYYGFPFPNTAYAKLNTGVDSGYLLNQGLKYIYHTISLDPVTFLVILLGIFSFFIVWKKKVLPISAGILLYILYVIKVGGDFMGGRFLAAPMLCAVIALSQLEFKGIKTFWLPFVMFTLYTGLQSSYNPIMSGKDYKNMKVTEGLVADERGVYYPASGLLTADRDNFIPRLWWSTWGLENKANGPDVKVFGYIGVYGFYSGPEVHIVDYHALTDPLLARIHIPPKGKWRIGHFEREIPPGYLETLKTGENQFTDNNLARYWNKLSLVISGPLFSRERFKEIWNFNTGKNDYLLGRYNQSLFREPLKNLSTPKKEGTPWNKKGNVVFYKDGLEIELGKIFKSPEIEVSLDCNDVYEIAFQKDGVIKGSAATSLKTKVTGLAIYTLTVPEEAVKSGYDMLLISPQMGDSHYSIGHIKLKS